MMAAAKLAVTVIVSDPETWQPLVLGPDSTEIPDWAVEQIGDHAWEGGKAPGKRTPARSKD